MKRLAIICLLLAGCQGHLITPVPPLPSVAPAIAPPTVSLLPTVTPTPDTRSTP